MTTINLIMVIEIIIFLLLFGLYFIYLYPKSSKEKKISILNQLIEDTNQKDKTTEDVTLLKASPDTYFKSKLPKVEGLKEWINHSGLNIKPITLILIGLFIGISFVFLFAFLLKKNILLSFLFGVVLSFFLPWLVIKILISNRKKKFLEEFPIALDILRRALRAGHSVDRAISMISTQLIGVVGESFKEMLDLLKLGKSFEDVLAEMSNRLGIDDFRMLAIVIVLQRETGGSLAETIDNFSKIIRARQQLRKKVKALTAEVRVTAMILTAIPFAIFGVVYITTPNYFDPLFNTSNGQTILWTGIGMLVVGVGSIVRMTYKEHY